MGDTHTTNVAWSRYYFRTAIVMETNGYMPYGQGNVCCIGGARGVMVIVIGNGHGDTSSNLARD